MAPVRVSGRPHSATRARPALASKKKSARVVFTSDIAAGEALLHLKRSTDSARSRRKLLLHVSCISAMLGISSHRSWASGCGGGSSSTATHGDLPHSRSAAAEATGQPGTGSSTVAVADIGGSSPALAEVTTAWADRLSEVDGGGGGGGGGGAPSKKRSRSEDGPGVPGGRGSSLKRARRSSGFVVELGQAACRQWSGDGIAGGVVGTPASSAQNVGLRSSWIEKGKGKGPARDRSSGSGSGSGNDRSVVLAPPVWSTPDAGWLGTSQGASSGKKRRREEVEGASNGKKDSRQAKRRRTQAFLFT